MFLRMPESTARRSLHQSPRVSAREALVSASQGPQPRSAAQIQGVSQPHSRGAPESEADGESVACLDHASELEKTEKTYIGTKVEILVRDFFRLPKGILDLTIDGLDVDVNEDEYPEDELPPGSECSP